MIVYRVVQARWKDDIWSGTGAWKHDGRWHTQGHRVVYAAESLALATLETLVHLRKTRRMKRYYRSRAEIPDKLIQTFPRGKLPKDWRNPEYPASTKKVGDRWLDAKAGLALRVPSAASPSEYDVLINPEHPAFKKVRILETEILVLDPRLIQ
jgi:RES domain-containing protein